ncbi:unnamed protein product [Prunus armeniaca]|uniref:Uncharacterized protein n=1 Tax=Prunus armeniaca TaxID=36596 RepID=A0A6J5VE85_PRUAR|nr:unnamed protein product [Prunus armeniaca]
MELSVKQGTRRGGQVSRGDQDQPAEIGQTSKVRISREKRLKKIQGRSSGRRKVINSGSKCQTKDPKGSLYAPRSQKFRKILRAKNFDIYFKSFLCCGFLYLPKIKVDDSMGPKFMNLIAYEMCPDFQNDFGVTSYIGFLDSLIDYADDVKHLRKSHILRNFLGSDDEVAKLFNEIGTDLVPNTAIYYDVKRKIEDHYKTNWKKWMAQFFHEHFSSPWTILAFIGVLLGLGMTAAQTWYAANSGTPCEALLEYLKERGY